MKRTKSRWPNNAVVGYIDASALGAVAAITQQQVQSYDVIIFGFTADGHVDNEVLNAMKKIKPWQTQGTLNLLSLGGAAAQGLKLDEILVNNLLASLQEFGLDGIDLDIEDPQIPINTLQEFTHNLKEALGGEYLLTTAPILAGTPDAPTLNIPNGGPSMAAIYATAVFDAILVQAYNSGLNFTYRDPKDNTLVNEANPDIIRAAYNSLQLQGNISSASQIVIGIAANAGGAPTASNLWNVDSDSAIAEVTNSVKQNLEDITLGNYRINPVQFGGLMTWSLNTDAMPSAYTPSAGYKNAPPGYFAQNVARWMLNDLSTVQVKAESLA
ncbi:glycosyl hydrolase family 18 protein [Shewanella abyssi]|uniref:glycosyl hydrolase family 18 protein n=1 Tax=Shewanella abyssi TaxID=311789 RepID=UPI00200CE3E2|nr:glycosyl hydrolase family 18 protein [Shewanella abyssi]MCL1051834.1 glycosyl hydrolase family 18 protein [Shewanella abyssi]